MTSSDQRIKGAIDRSIAEEQARQKAFAGQKDGGSSSSTRRSGSISRSSSTRGAESPARRPRISKPIQDTNGDGTANTDPAVFEAAFVIDDTEEGTPAPTPSATPQPEEASKSVEQPKNDATPAKQASEHTTPSNNAQQNGEKSNGAKEPPQESKPLPEAQPELPPDVRTKLRKLEKLEKTYPGSFHQHASV